MWYFVAFGGKLLAFHCVLDGNVAVVGPEDASANRDRSVS